MLPSLVLSPLQQAFDAHLRGFRHQRRIKQAQLLQQGQEVSEMLQVRAGQGTHPPSRFPALPARLPALDPLLPAVYGQHPPPCAHSHKCDASLL